MTHNWSGWPGAFCLNCGAPQLLEIAIGEGYYNPFAETWDTPEHQAEYTDGACPHILALAAEYLDYITQMRDTTLDADARRHLSAQRSLAHDALIAALGPVYARPFDMQAWCRELLREESHNEPRT